MATVAKPRKPVADATKVAQLAAASTLALTPEEENMTVEQYLEKQFETMMKEFRAHSDGLITKLRNDYQDGAAQIRLLMTNNAAPSPLCVILKCINGPHAGQKFRLEGSANGEDVFRMGRSTGKAFKEKGVSLYKDKEISTTHAKVEIKNGQAFLMDADSTNGTLLNGEDVKPLTPYRLKNEDIIIMGSTELCVHLSTVDQENVASNA